MMWFFVLQPIRQEKKTDTTVKENGVAPDKVERKDSSDSNENANEPAKPTTEHVSIFIVSFFLSPAND